MGDSSCWTGKPVVWALEEDLNVPQMSFARAETSSELLLLQGKSSSSFIGFTLIKIQYSFKGWMANSHTDSVLVVQMNVDREKEQKQRLHRREITHTRTYILLLVHSTHAHTNSHSRCTSLMVSFIKDV